MSRALLLLPVVLLVSCETESFDTPVRSTLSDGQVLMGFVQTEVIALHLLKGNRELGRIVAGTSKRMVVLGLNGFGSF